MKPVHRKSFFLNHIFVQKKILIIIIPKYQLGSFTVHFSAIRTHIPSLVGGLAAMLASCLSQNVGPGKEIVDVDV